MRKREAHKLTRIPRTGRKLNFLHANEIANPTATANLWLFLNEWTGQTVGGPTQKPTKRKDIVLAVWVAAIPLLLRWLGLLINLFSLHAWNKLWSHVSRAQSSELFDLPLMAKWQSAGAVSLAIRRQLSAASAWALLLPTSPPSTIHNSQLYVQKRVFSFNRFCVETCLPAASSVCQWNMGAGTAGAVHHPPTVPTHNTPPSVQQINKQETPDSGKWKETMLLVHQ